MFVETKLGYEYAHQEFLVFFGKKGVSLERLKDHYGTLEFRSVRQTHSDILLESSAEEILREADAHFTTEKNTALIIRTADCLPIMMYEKSTTRIAAIHAGWRGVANQITLKSLSTLNVKGPLSVFIGPHIMQDSFEVNNDVRDLLLSSSPVKSRLLSQDKDEKSLVNLRAIVCEQIKLAIPAAGIETLAMDTFTNTQFCSFRRDRTPERNLSFIALHS